MSSITAATLKPVGIAHGDKVLVRSSADALTQSSMRPRQAALYDPSRPILHQHGRSPQALSGSRYNQRSRRSHILATIRRLLTEHGFVGVTVRRIAQVSGYAVQTIYSLVGPRDEAIIEAINEYVRYVGRTTEPRWDDPYAVMGLTDGWVQSMATTPEFCRQVSLIFFTESRSVFYTFRDQQLGRMFNLLTRQQKCGVFKAEINIRDLAEQLVVLSTGLCLEWSDRPFPLEQLHRRLDSGYRSLLAAAINPDFVAPAGKATDRKEPTASM
jgi:AcrR family transcriptional regulator